MSARACEACGDLVRASEDRRRKRTFCSELYRSTTLRSSRRAGLLERACARCGSSMSGRSDQRYCSVKCRIAARREDPAGVAAADEVDRDAEVTEDLALYIDQIGSSRLTAQLPEAAKLRLAESLEDAARSLRGETVRGETKRDETMRGAMRG